MIGVGSAVNGRPDDRVYLFLPMYHTNGGLIAPGAALPFGGSCYIRERFSASGFWNDVTRERCTLFIYVGEVCRYLYNAPPSPAERAHQLRACVGNGLRSDIFAAFQKRFVIPQIIEFYASTEGNLLIINLDSHPGAIGRIPAWARRRFLVKIVAYDHEANTQKRDAAGRCIECKPEEPGELISQINNDPKMLAARFDGYADPSATQQKVLRDVFEAGRYVVSHRRPGAPGRHGYFYFVDRVGDTFRWKGENVSTVEVAETLARFSGVREAVVYGVAVPGHDGRAGMAALVVDSIATFDLDGFRAFVAERLPVYARPIFLRFRTQLEVNATFKLLRSELVADGFDPARVGDPIYFDSRALGAYARVDEALIAGLKLGQIRF